MFKLTAANVAHNVAVENALNEVRTQDEMETALSQIVALSAPVDTATVDISELGSDVIAILGDGSALCWGAEIWRGGRSFRSIVVYGGQEDGRGVMIAELQADIWEDSQVAED